jgi:putative sigma-54 modulation protein
VKVVVHDRTRQVPARVRTYAEGKLQKLARHFDRVVEVAVQFEKEGGSPETAHLVLIQVRTQGRRHPLAKAQERGADPRAVFDLALDKIDRQVVKLKEKIKVERKRPPAPPAAPSSAAVEGRERIRVHLRPESAESVAAAVEQGADHFKVYLDEDTGEVSVAYRKRDGSVAIIEPIVG